MRKDQVEMDEQETGLFRRREPYNFMLGLAIFGISLMFLMLVGLYTLRLGQHLAQIDFELPQVFWYSTLIILVSSLTLHLAGKDLQAERFLRYRIMMLITFLLGSFFLILQLQGWLDMQAQGIFLEKSLSGSFVYIISGLHAIHILGGLIFLLYMVVEALQQYHYVDSFVYSINPPNQLRLKLISRYWHFVDILWVLLFCLFLYNHS